MIDLAELPDGTLCERYRDNEKLISSLQLEQSCLLALIDRRRAFQAEGPCLSTTSWLRSVGLTQKRAKEMIGVARRLEVTPRAAAGVESGEISFDHLRMVSFTASRLPEGLREEADKALTPHAKHLDPSRLAMAGRFLRSQLDQEGALGENDKQFSNRYFELSQTLDGVWHLDGLLDPEGGATLKTALEAVLGPRLKADERAHWQRSADGLVELSRRLLDSGRLPQRGGQKPHLALVIGAEALKGGEAGALDWAGPVPGETVRRLACDCALSLLVTDDKGEVIFGSAEKRVIPPSLRRAVNRRDKTCLVQGCDRPASWNDIHHFEHHIDGGETVPKNLGSFCRRHHRMVHEGRWKIQRADDGRVVLAEPDWPDSG